MMPVLFKIGSFPIHSWGLLLMTGFLLATWRAARNGGRYDISPENVWDIALWSLLGGVIGARLAYIAQNIPTYAPNPLRIFALQEGGMTFYGGLFGGILAGWLACRKRSVVSLDMADLAAVSMPIGYALGRVGCFLNGCCYGGVCDLPWAVQFHKPEGGLTPPSHPAQLYAVIISIGMYFLLLPLERARKFRGQIILAYVVLYAVYRFFIEFVREGATADVTGFLHLTTGQIASILFAVIAGGLYVAASRRKTARPIAAPANLKPVR